MDKIFNRALNTIIVVLFIVGVFTAGFTVGRNMRVTYAAEQPAETQPAEIVTEIVEAEAAPIAAEGAGRYTRVIQVTATAYCPCVKCCGKTDGITATGTNATAGRTVAVDPDVIPYGSEIVIDGHTYIAEDCGGAIDGNDIDIFFDTHEEARQFGRQILTAYINE